MSLQECLSALVSSLPSSTVVISPGSRNAALIRTFIQLKYECHSVVDERSAGFIALGMARAKGSPVVLCCTSGTAVLNYYPAIAEAFYSRVPLIVISADRPSEDIDQWEGQSIRQKGIFDLHIRRSWETSEEFKEQAKFRKTGVEVRTYFEQYKLNIWGPIHINVPIPEPFYEIEPWNPEEKVSIAQSTVDSISADQIRSMLQISGDKKMMCFNGYEDMNGYRIESGEDSDELVISDVCSGAESDFYTWDALFFKALEQGKSLDELRPDVLVTTGLTTVSKGLKKIAKHWMIKEHYHLSKHTELGKMFGTSPILVDPRGFANTGPLVKTSSDFKELWKKASDDFQIKMDGLDWSQWTEFSALKKGLSLMLKEDLIHLGNSMPVRYVSYLGLAQEQGQRSKFYGNRGTSGIDGCMSASIGHAISVDQRVFLIIGDLSFYYDLNALWQEKLPNNFKVIVLNNQGGQIFRYLNGPDRFESAFEFQLTKHQREFKGICEHFGLRYFCASDSQSLSNHWQAFAEQPGAALLEIKTDPERNYEFYQIFKNIP